MRNGRRLVVLICVIVLFTGCGGGGGGPSDPGGGNTGGNTFTAIIDGVPWASDEASISVSGAGAPTRAGTVLLSGYEAATGRGLTLSISFFIGPASQPLGVNIGTTPGGIGSVIVPPNNWSTPLSGASGFITLTQRTDTRIAGTFNFTATALAGATPASRVVTAGAFDVTKASGLPPLPTGVGSTAIATIGGLPYNFATIIALNGGGGVFSLAADNTSYSISLTPKQPVAAGNTYGIPSQMNLTIIRTGATDSWWGGTGPDVGAVTISTLNADRIIASFNGTLLPLNAATALTVAGGAINAYMSPVQ